MGVSVQILQLTLPTSNEHQLASTTKSHLASVPQLVVEDALHARAEQAQSTAEHLLELVEPKDVHHKHPYYSTTGLPD